ncbi:MAG: DUF3052 domain-containing protein [Gemmatimonadales bacterium]
MAGYSPRPLIAKLGIKTGSRIAVLGAPKGYGATLGNLPSGVAVQRTARGKGRLPFIHLFTRRRHELEERLPGLLRALTSDGALWISWPKRSARVTTDVTEDVVRAVALPLGLVDVKVCAVDEVWSGLKLVRRLERR